MVAGHFADRDGRGEESVRGSEDSGCDKERVEQRPSLPSEEGIVVVCLGGVRGAMSEPRCGEERECA